MLVSRLKFEDIEYGEPYWMLDHARKPYKKKEFYKGLIDSSRFTSGNYFKTEEEALRCITETKIYLILQFYSKEFNVGSENWYIYYDYDKGQLDYGCTKSIKHCDLYFATKEDAMHAVEVVTLDRLLKYYLNIPESDLSGDICGSSVMSDLSYLHRKYIEILPDFF